MEQTNLEVAIDYINGRIEELRVKAEHYDAIYGAGYAADMADCLEEAVEVLTSVNTKTKNFLL